MPIGIVLAQRAASFDAKATTGDGKWAETWSRSQRDRGSERSEEAADGDARVPDGELEGLDRGSNGKGSCQSEMGCTTGNGRSREKASTCGPAMEHGQTYLKQPEETRGVLSCANQVRTLRPGSSTSS